MRQNQYWFKMCDATAGILALARCLAQSCEYLYVTLRSITEASDELGPSLSGLQALQSALTGISTLERETPGGVPISPDFEHRLHECAVDLQEMLKLTKSFRAQTKGSKIQKTMARIRWTSVDQKQELKRRLSRIESHQRDFKLDLLVLNTWD